MKIFLIVSSFLIVGNLCAKSVNNNNIVSKYTNMFERIGKKRVGIKESKIDSLSPPFVTIVRKKSSSRDTPIVAKVNSSPILKAIFNNQAKIGEKWYKLHDMLNEMEIVAIKDNYIVLKNEKKSKKLKLGRKNANITIK